MTTYIWSINKLAQKLGRKINSHIKLINFKVTKYTGFDFYSNMMEDSKTSVTCTDTVIQTRKLL